VSGSWTPNGRLARLSVAVTLLLAGLLLLGPAPAQAQPAFVAGQNVYQNFGGVSTGSITLPSPSTTGNLIVLSFNVDGPDRTVTAVTDNKSNSYSLATGPLDHSSPGQRLWTCYANNITGGGAAITITITLSGAANLYFEAYALERSGVATASPVDQTSSGSGNSMTLSSGSKTTTSADELMYGVCFQQGIGTVDPPFTARDTSNGNFVADRTVLATGSYAVTGTKPVAAYWGCQMVTFKAPPTKAVGFGYRKPITPAPGPAGRPRLNGYFVAASFESLSESLLKAEGRGAIAAFSPSGLSVDGGGAREREARASGGRDPGRAEDLRGDGPHAGAAIGLPPARRSGHEGSMRRPGDVRRRS
jgi:hypothetical protein